MLYVRMEKTKMSKHSVAKIITALEITEGAGVTVFRTIGSPSCRNLDPFLLLDHMSSDNPDEYIAGFPEHPHRGFVTFTYLIDGHLRHKDSMGNQGELKAGGAQWMKAASGVIHSEMPQQVEGLLKGFQLWINLPKSEKMSCPEYKEIKPDSVPTINQKEKTVRVLAGDYEGCSGPPFIKHEYASWQWGYGAYPHAVEARIADIGNNTLPGNHTAILYVFEGEANVSQTLVSQFNLAILKPDNSDEACSDVEIWAGPEGARMLLVTGKPIGEPILQYGPFVMNERAEIEQAIKDFEDGTLVKSKADMQEI